MTTPFLGEIQIFGFTFAPYQWASANGATLPISQYAALFSLIGTNFGGNGQTSFQLPNLVDRSSCGQGQGPALSNRVIGEAFGEASVALQQNQLPQHNHTVTAYAERGTANKVGKPTTGALLGTPTAPLSTLAATPPNTSLAPNALSVSGGNQPHENRQPLLALNYAIALYGAFPSFS